jgi:hypothetical protein
MCEGWSVEINAFRGPVVRQDRVEQLWTWLASVNAAYLREYFDRDSAMTRVQSGIENNMQMLPDWGCIRGRSKSGWRSKSGLSAR